MAAIEVSEEQLMLLEAVLDEAVENAEAQLDQFKTLYSDAYRPYRIAAAREELRMAKDALAMVKGWPR